MNKVVVIIPALNEADAIAHVVQAIPAALVDRVIVVDGGSTDGTVAAARAAGADVVMQPQRGYGNACRAGVDAAPEADVLVFLDGDGSFDSAQIAALIAPILADEAEFVLGSRELGGIERSSMPPQQRFGNRLVAWLLHRLYGLEVTDVGPFRAIRRSTLELLDMREPTYGWPTEMIVKAARRHIRIQEVPTTYRARMGGKSKVSGTVRGSILAGYQMLALTLKYAWQQPEV
jgi:glycosyltransferase involved in cell wall biosynthesis